MNQQPVFRPALEADLPEVLRLYAQPEIDDGDVLALPGATRIWARMASYPNYKLYAAVQGAVQGAQVVGTFALLIMDNLGPPGRAIGGG